MPSIRLFFRRVPAGTRLKGDTLKLETYVSEWLFSKTGTTTGVGTIRWKKYTIEQLIVAKPNYEQQKEHLAAFENLKAGKMSISDFKDFSNKLMYKIYELTNEEIRAIENLYN